MDLQLVESSQEQVERHSETYQVFTEGPSMQSLGVNLGKKRLTGFENSPDLTLDIKKVD